MAERFDEVSDVGPATGAVVVAHPGRQHVYETVAAARDCGMLRAFATGLYFGSGVTGALGRAVEQLAPGSEVARIVRHRRSAELAGVDVVSFPAALIAARALRRAPGLSEASLAAEWWVDRRIARWLAAARPAPRVVHGFEGGCLRTLAAARSVGAATVLDVPNAHEAVNEAFTSEGYRGSSPRLTRQVRAERELADRLLVPSEFVRSCLVANGVEPARIVHVPYGVDPAEFSPAEDNERSSRFRVLFVGLISPRKGVQYLLEAWHRLALRDAELVFAGSLGPGGGLLLRRFEGSFAWVGPVAHAELPALYRSAHVFAFPSLAEGSALVTYEAMATGLPVITTPNSGSVIKNGVDGLIVPPRDSQALAEKMLLLHRDPDLRRELGLRARQTILEGYTWEHYRQRVRSVYEGLLGGHGPHPTPLIGTGQ